MAAETDSRLPAVEAAAAEAERDWRTALLSRRPNAEEFRSQLVTGAPCPVCGALDHPWGAVEAPQLDELASNSGKRREALAAELAVLRGRRAQQETWLEQLQARIRGQTSGSIRSCLSDRGCVRESKKRLAALGSPIRVRLRKPGLP